MAATTATPAPAPPAAPGVAELRAALANVRDPELDEPITALGFVAACAISADGDAEVRLRLPTYFCAPNFAYLMAADAHDAVTALPGVRTARVLLEDHFAADTINSGVAAQAGFVQSFSGEAEGELEDLRCQFLRKAVLAGTDQICRALCASGIVPAGAAGFARLQTLTLAEVPPSPAADRLRRRRAELGLPAGDDDLLLLDPATGERVEAPAVPLHLRRARLTAISIEANASICSGMLRHRYSSPGIGEIPPGGTTPGEEDQ
jgi:metal-sulfur cluster biosynthetic enzyme